MDFIDASTIIAGILDAAKADPREKKSAFKNESVYIEDELWKGWVTVRELIGKERGIYLKKSINKQNGDVNFEILNPYMVVLCARYPDPFFPPPEDHPHYKEFPGLKDENGKYITEPHPKRTELMFEVAHVGILNSGSGGTLEEIAQLAGRLSKLRPEDLEKKRRISDLEEWEKENSTDA